MHSGPRGQEEPGIQGQDGQLLPWERAFQAQEPANIIWSQDRPGGKVSAFPPKRPGEGLPNSLCQELAEQELELGSVAAQAVIAKVPGSLEAKTKSDQ